MKDPMKSISFVAKTIPGVGCCGVGYTGVVWGGVGEIIDVTLPEPDAE